MYTYENMSALPASTTPLAPPPFTYDGVMEDVQMGDIEHCQTCQDEMDRQVGATVRANLPNLYVDSMLGVQPEFVAVDPAEIDYRMSDPSIPERCLGLWEDINGPFPDPDHTDDEYPEGLALSDDELEAEDFPGDFDAYMANYGTNVWESGLPSEFDAVSDVAPVPTVRPDQGLIDALTDAMSRDNLLQDLLHYQWTQEPSPDYPFDRIYHLLQQYACAHRFLAVRRRWAVRSMKIIDWIKEMRLLLAASNEPNNKMTLWPQMDVIFSRFEELTRSDEYLVARDRMCSTVAARRTLVAEMDKVGEATCKAVEMELKGMLPKDLPVEKLRGVVKKVIAEDCEERGSLILGGVPGFTEETKCEMTQSWSWTD